jgi:hypothetical protein
VRGPELKPFAQKKQVEEVLRTLKKCSQGVSPITGKAEHVLLSIVLLYCILIAFLCLGCFCQSVYIFEVAICRIH